MKIRASRSMVALALSSHIACAMADDNPYEDPPPERATHGIANCAQPKVQVLSPDDARREAHQRVERGTSCWLAGKCEPGGDYKDDGKVNRRVVKAIAQDARFVDSSIWVETLRKFVTLKGCIVDVDQGRALEALVRSVDGVKLVWMEAKVPAPAAR